MLTLKKKNLRQMSKTCNTLSRPCKRIKKTYGTCLKRVSKQTCLNIKFTLSSTQATSNISFFIVIFLQIYAFFSNTAS